MIGKAGGVKVDEEATEFDRIMESFEPTLEKYGVTEQVRENRELLDRNKGICVFVYEFAG